MQNNVPHNGASFSAAGSPAVILRSLLQPENIRHQYTRAVDQINNMVMCHAWCVEIGQQPSVTRRHIVEFLPHGFVYEASPVGMRIVSTNNFNAPLQRAQRDDFGQV